VDRALRRLALRTLREVCLGHGPGSGPGPRLSADTTVRNAVSLMLELGVDEVQVDDLGVFRLSDVHTLL
jgi:hypothetical protein